MDGGEGRGWCGAPKQGHRVKGLMKNYKDFKERDKDKKKDKCGTKKYCVSSINTILEHRGQILRSHLLDGKLFYLFYEFFFPFDQ